MIMNVLQALLVAALSQATPPKLIVVEGANLGVHEMRVQELVDAVAELARLDGFEASVASRACADRACLRSLGREENADAVVSASFAAVGRDAVMDLEGTDAMSGASFGQLTFTVRAGTRSDLVMNPIPFLRAIKRSLLETPRLPVQQQADKPEAPQPLQPPAPCPDPEPAVTAAAPRSGPVVPWVTGAVGFGGLVGVGALLAINGVEADSLSRSLDRGLVPYNRVEQAVMIDERNRAAIGLLIASGVTLAVTLIIALVSSSGSEGQ